MTSATRRSVEAFILAHSGPPMDQRWIDLVLGQVVAGPDWVWELSRRGERVGVAVLVDTCKTFDNAAELSMFVAPGDEQAVGALLEWADGRTTGGKRDHIDVPLWPGAGVSEVALAARGYRVGYVMHTMVRPPPWQPVSDPDRALPEGLRWSDADPSLADSYHRTLSAAFAAVPGAFVPDLDTFRSRLGGFDPRPRLLVDGEQRVAGFVRVELRPDGDGDLASLGRHPDYRGAGLGPLLVTHGLEILRARGVTAVHLEVAAVNVRGIALYRSFGFEQRERIPVYRRRVAAARS